MLVAVPSGTGRMLTAHPATPILTHPALRLPWLWGHCQLPPLQWGTNFAGGAHRTPSPTGTAHHSFPGPSGKAGALPAVQEGAEPRKAATCLKATASATAEFRELLDPSPAAGTADGRGVPALCGSAWLPHPAQHRRARARAAGSSSPPPAEQQPDAGVQEIGETFISLQKYKA